MNNAVTSVPPVEDPNRSSAKVTGMSRLVVRQIGHNNVLSSLPALQTDSPGTHAAAGWLHGDLPVPDVNHLCTMLRARAPGLRVLVLHHGAQEFVDGLAAAGLSVCALTLENDDASDELGDQSWGEVDAVICTGGMGWGDVRSQRKLLRCIHRHLVDDGILVVIVPTLPWIMAQCAQPTKVSVAGVSYHLYQHYDVVSGCVHGRLETDASAGSSHAFARRILTLPEACQSLRAAGFMVDDLAQAIEPDGVTPDGAAPGATGQSVQLWARRVAHPPDALAVRAWGIPSQAKLDLRYAPDEAPWLTPTPAAIWAEVIARESHQGADAVGWYAVDDPYGEVRAAAVVAAHFACPIAPQQVTLGAGVTSLLHDLVHLAEGGLVLGRALVHPDLSAWALAQGCQVHLLSEPATLEDFLDAIHRLRPALVQLDRPNFAGECIAPDELVALCRAAALVGGVVLVDESPATYLGPAESVVRLIGAVDNLIVLRGLTKAYSWGGLRVAFAFASSAISGRVREVVCPLQVGELALRAALHLLAQGDIFQPLRAQIRVAKAQTLQLFRAAHFDVYAGHPVLPWLIVPDTGGEASARLQKLGIRGLRFVPSPALRPPGPELVALFSPLSAPRMAALRAHLSADNVMASYGSGSLAQALTGQITEESRP